MIFDFQEWRKNGFGERICHHAVKLAESKCSTKVLVLQSQLDALKFYEHLGFKVVSDEYLEAGILHRVSKLVSFFIRHCLCADAKRIVGPVISVRPSVSLQLSSLSHWTNLKHIREVGSEWPRDSLVLILFFQNSSYHLVTNTTDSISQCSRFGILFSFSYFFLLVY